MFTLAMGKSGVLLSEILCDISRTLLTAVRVFNPAPHLFYIPLPVATNVAISSAHFRNFLPER